MSPSADDLAHVMDRWNVTNGQLALGINRTLEDVMHWRIGHRPVPHFVLIAVEALGRKMPPAPDHQMQQHGDRLAGMLGVQIERVDYWHKTRSYPQATRLAVSLLDLMAMKDKPVEAYEKVTLGRIIKYRYFRVRNGWRPKATIGSQAPSMQYETPRSLLNSGHVELTSEGELRATKKGRDLYYENRR